MRVDRDKLMLAMANACMNTSDLEKATQMPRPTLNNVITGRSVRTKTIGKVAKALGIPVENILLFEEGESDEIGS